MSFVVSPIIRLTPHRYYGLLRLLIQPPSGLHLFGLYLLLVRFCAAHWMRPLLFHRLLSPHPVLPTPESSSRLFPQSSGIASGSMPLLLPSPCVTGSALSFSLTGQHVGAASFTLCYGLLLCFPFSGSYNASTQSVTRLHRLPAIRRPDTYRNWTFTSEQTMSFQDAPRCVRRATDLSIY